MAQQYSNPWAQAISDYAQHARVTKQNAFIKDEGDFWYNHSYKGQFKVNPGGEGLSFVGPAGTPYKGLPSEGEAYEQYKHLHSKHGYTPNYVEFSKKWAEHKKKYGGQLASFMTGMTRQGFTEKALKDAVRANPNLGNIISEFMVDAEIGPVLNSFIPEKTSAVGQPFRPGALGQPRAVELGGIAAARLAARQWGPEALQGASKSRALMPGAQTFDIGRGAYTGERRRFRDFMKGDMFKDNVDVIDEMYKEVNEMEGTKKQKTFKKYKKDGKTRGGKKFKSGKKKGQFKPGQAPKTYKKGQYILDKS